MDNILDKKRIENFIQSFYNNESECINNIYDYCIKNDIPIIKTPTKHFIRSIINIKKPSKILEIGSAVGYSSIIIYDEVKKYCKNPIIYTIENYPKRIEKARENFENYGYRDIVLFKDDASIILNKLVATGDKFDFIFLDAAKAQYPIWLSDIKKLLNKDGLLIADNIFKDGEIFESRYLIRKRDRTIHQRMREFLHKIFNDKDLISYVYDIGDGISMSIMNNE
jgi:predicted O-methyltransferase YrrM